MCLFHFTKGYVPDDSWLAYMVIHYGWIGVEIFFVVSGFVIPYGLLNSNYAAKNYGGFLLKRLVRIHPAYIASIALVLILNFLSTRFSVYNGLPFSISYSNLIAHFFYAVDLFNQTWLNPVYWTLAIEFQYYLIIGLLLIIWNRSDKLILILSFVLLLISSFLNINYFDFFNYADVFCIGVVVAFYKRDRLNKSVLVSSMFIIAMIILFNHGLAIMTLVTLTAIIIAFFGFKLQHPALLFLGNISYSLYLIHIPVGGRIINLSKRLELTIPMQIAFILLALLVSGVTAWLFYIYIEKPSHKWSRSIKMIKN